MNRLFRYARKKNLICAIMVASACFIPFSSSKAQSSLVVCKEIDVRQHESPEFLAVAALSDKSCIEKILSKGGSDAYRLVLLAGFPSLLIDKMPDKDLIALLYNAVSQGDRWLFSRDQNLPRSLASLYERAGTEEKPLISVIHDFALGSLPQGGNDKPMDRRQFAMLALISRISINDITEFCTSQSCMLLGDATNLCSGVSTPEFKSLYFKDADSAVLRLKSCKLDTQLIASLRASGVFDGSCSFSTQMNSIARNNISLNSTCDALLRNLSDSALSSEDVIQYLRLINNYRWSDTISRTQKELNSITLDRFSDGLSRYANMN